MALMEIAYAGFKRYQSRRRNFTVIIIGSYLLICIFMLFFQTTYQNIYQFWVANYVGGDIIVSKDVRAYDFQHPLSPEHYFNFHKFINNNPAFKEKVSPCLRVGALLEDKMFGRSMYCVVNGIDQMNKKGFVNQLNLVDGRMFNNRRNEVVLPQQLAYRLGVGLGDSLVIYVMTKDGYQNFDLLKVVGLLNIALPAQTFYSQTMVYMPLVKLRELLTVGSDQVSEVVVFKKLGLLRAPLRGDFQQISGFTSFSLVRSLFFAFCFLEVIILFLVFVMAFCTIYQNVGLMNIEREKEIGIYLTNGAKPFWIRRLMFYELLFYSVYCSIWGGLLSLLVVIGVNNSGINFSDLPTKLLMACDHFIIGNHFETYLLSFLIILLLMIIGSWGPIWRATENTRITALFQKN
jgi:ABC-type lipoprotein release transport system permease subunit